MRAVNHSCKWIYQGICEGEGDHPYKTKRPGPQFCMLGNAGTHGSAQQSSCEMEKLGVDNFPSWMSWLKEAI